MGRSASITLGLLMLIGSLLALFTLFPFLAHTGKLTPLLEIALFLLAVLYGVGAWCGLQALRQAPSWQVWGRWFWLLQVPMFSTPSMSFLTSCGAGAWVYMRFGNHGLQPGGSMLLGSAVSVTSGQISPDLMVGINLFATALAAFLFWSTRRASRMLDE